MVNKRVIAVLGISALVWATAALTPVGAKPGSQDVLVVNGAGEPVPVAGEVAATQGGEWNVGITGTPQVAVLDAREPFEARADDHLTDGDFSGSASFDLPDDKRFVAEFLSVNVSQSPGSTPLVNFNANGGATGGFVPLELQGTTSGSSGVFEHYMAAIPILDITEPGGLFRVSLFRLSPSNGTAPGEASLSAFVSGYLEAV